MNIGYGFGSIWGAKVAELIKRKLINIAEDGSFQLDELFNFATGLRMTNKKFHDLLEVFQELWNQIPPKEKWIYCIHSEGNEDVVVKLAQDIAEKLRKKSLLSRWSRSKLCN